jgi:predicted NAD-dependent protein-ADP-ribosyltransferase YbiA (DUF1768 family)
MSKGIRAKFSAAGMKQHLLASSGTLGEATRHSYWGIGHNLHSEGANLIANWDGENVLGTLLTELREELKA